VSWRNLDKTRPDSAHYSIMGLASGERGEGAMDALRAMFPDGKADEMNAVLFSTSGVHGTYTTIEEVEATLKGEAEPDEQCHDVTYLIVHPRIVALRYGNCQPETQDDIDFLKKLRATSRAAFAQIGWPAP
jgi:hypothetical protein